jgi:S-adenosylmethionine-diacylgycerolhomoserine-N-methlytransferase
MANQALISDAERMDRHYRYQRFIYDNTRTHYLIGRRHLISSLNAHPGDSILEVGCGTAWNLAKAAKAYPGAKLYGIDVSNAMLGTARASLTRQCLEQRVRLAQGDATNFQPYQSLNRFAFDRIFFSYALSMIPRWHDALSHTTQFLAPGGQLLIVDFGQGAGLPPAFNRAFSAFLRHYTVTPRADMEAVLAALADAEGLTLKFDRMHRGFTDFAVLTRR